MNRELNRTQSRVRRTQRRERLIAFREECFETLMFPICFWGAVDGLMYILHGIGYAWWFVVPLALIGGLPFSGVVLIPLLILFWLFDIAVNLLLPEAKPSKRNKRDRRDR